MIHFKLKDFVEKNIADFNPENSQDVIKAEKLLKAESKMNGTFSINEIDAFLDYLKNPSQNFDEILKISVIKDIYNGASPKNIEKKPDLSKISNSEAESFKEVFTPHLKDFFSENVRKNQWQTLMYFYKCYQSFMSVEAFEFLKNLIHDKNNLVVEGIENHDDLETIRKNYPYCNDNKFYFMQSMFDSFEFDEDILDINNAIARNQHTYAKNKIVLGEILLAIHYFDSQNPTTKNVIEDNQKIALSWTNVKQGFFSGISYWTANFFNPERKNKKQIFLVSVIFWLIVSSILIYLSLTDSKFFISICIALILVFLLYKKIPKRYIGIKKYDDPEEIFIQFTASTIIKATHGILWLIFAPIAIYGGFGILQREGTLPISWIIIAITFSIRFYQQTKYK